MPATDPPLRTGTHGEYRWLVSDCSLDELLRLCPGIVAGRYIAVTSFDSGPLYLIDENVASEWESRLGVAYSPKIQTIEGLPYDAGYEEWYVLNEPRDIGPRLAQGKNPFERPADSSEIFAFVNSHFGPDHKDPYIVEMFWRALSRIHPLSYIADNAWRVTFVTSDADAFLAAHSALAVIET